MSSISNLYIKNRDSCNYLTHKININWLSNEDCTIFVIQLKPLPLFTMVVTNPNFRDKNKLFDSFEKTTKIWMCYDQQHIVFPLVDSLHEWYEKDG